MDTVTGSTGPSLCLCRSYRTVTFLCHTTVSLSSPLIFPSSAPVQLRPNGGAVCLIALRQLRFGSGISGSLLPSALPRSKIEEDNDLARFTHTRTQLEHVAHKDTQARTRDGRTHTCTHSRSSAGFHGCNLRGPHRRNNNIAEEI